MTAFGISMAGDKMAAAHPMGRIGSPEDIAGLALFLCAHLTLLSPVSSSNHVQRAGLRPTSAAP